MSLRPVTQLKEISCMDGSENLTRTFVIAEAGVNHNGSLEGAHRLVDAAVVSGADAVKFQTFKAEKVASGEARKAQYQQKTTGGGGQLEMLRKLELRDTDYVALYRHCEDAGIEFMSTPFDAESADMLVALGMRRLKLPSGEITNFPLVTHLSRMNLPLIISTGMATMAEVEEVIAVISAVRKSEGRTAALQEVVSVLHCTSNYPTEPVDVNLRAISTMAKNLLVPVGFSDHTTGIDITLAAVACGATIIEKHFTLSRDQEGPDHAASLEPAELNEMIRGIRRIEVALGSGVKAPTESEAPVRLVARRSVAAGRDLSVGMIIGEGDLTLLRPGSGIPPRDLPGIVGRKLKRSVAASSLLDWADLV